jgi:hypothetical protein
MIPYTALTQGLALLQDRMPFSRQVKVKCPFARFGPWSCCKPRKPYSFSSLSPKLKQNMQHCSGCTWFCLHNMLLLAWQHLAMYCNTFFSLMYAEEWCCCMYNICTLHSPYTRLLPLCKALVCACTALLQGYCLYSRLQPFARQSTSCLFIFLKQFQPGS